MPNVKGAAVAVVGTILSVEQTLNFESKQPDGAKVMVGTRDGFAVVKLDSEQLNTLRPVIMQGFAGLVRYGAWAGRGNQGEETCRYVGPITDDWADFLGSTRAGIKNQPKAA